ncbi:hypothetical protein JW906_02105 [bacterium]|nr:hypothetical protein [bacterium]
MRKIISIVVLFAFGISHAGVRPVKTPAEPVKSAAQATSKKPALKEPRLRKKSAFDVKKTGLVAAGIAVAAVGTVVLTGKPAKEEPSSGKLPGPPDWPAP